MAHFKFLLDRDVVHLAHSFPQKRVFTTSDLGLPENAPDEDIIEEASREAFLIVTANRRDFAQKVPAYIAQSSRKDYGCHRVYGLLLLSPADQFTQERVLSGLENRLSLEGKKISFTDVHDRDLKVTVDSMGKAIVSRLPRCPYCRYDDER